MSYPTLSRPTKPSYYVMLKTSTSSSNSRGPPISGDNRKSWMTERANRVLRAAESVIDFVYPEYPPRCSSSK